jgi:hypothetical protein
MTTPNYLSFVDFYVPDINFDVTDVFQFPKIQDTVYAAPVYTAPQIVYNNSVNTAAPIQADLGIIKKTITFTVADETETLPGANIAVNGISTAITDGNGRVTLPNIDIDSVITVSYIGYDTYTMIASAIPAKVFLKSGATQLDEVIIQAWKKPVAPSNTWAWLLLGAVGVAAVYKYSKAGTKIVRAKI